MTPWTRRGLCLFLAVAIGAAAQEQVDPLDSVLQELAGLRQQDPGALRDPVAVEGWIDALEAALVMTARDDLRAGARLVLADMNMVLGATDEALTVYGDVADDASAPAGVRLQALFTASHAATTGGDALAALPWLDRFETQVDAFHRDGTPVPPQYEQQWWNLGRIRGDLLAHAADQLLLAGTGDAAEAMLERAIDAYRGHLEAMHDFPEDELPPLDSTDAALFSLARALSGLADMRDRLGDPEAAQRTSMDVVDLLQDHLERHPSSPHRVPAASLLLRDAFRALGPGAAYRRFVADLATRMPPNHQMLSFLRAQATALSNDAGRLAAANELFDVLLDLEQEWFPDEFGDHTNYQWALIFSARNALRLGDLELVADRLNLIEQLNVRGASARELVTELQQQYLEHLAAGYGTAIDAADVLPPPPATPGTRMPGTDPPSAVPRASGAHDRDDPARIGDAGGASPSRERAAPSRGRGSAALLIALGVGLAIGAVVLVRAGRR